MNASRSPNHQLRALLDEANWTGDALARAVNAAGSEAGLSLHYGRASVAHWLSGVQARSPVLRLVAEVFTRKLERSVTQTDTGFVCVQGHVEPTDGLLDQLSRLVSCDDADGAVYRLTTFPTPEWGRPALDIAQPNRTVLERARLGSAEVTAAELMCEVFSRADAEFGGGHGRAALGGYLGCTVVSWLRATASPSVRRRMQATAARLCHLHGYMCFDEHLHGLAQRQYLASAELAADAGDRTGYACALRALGAQASHLGHHDEALQILKNAFRAARSGPVSPPALASLHGQVAVALAAAGDQELALVHLDEAEGTLANADGDHQLAGNFHAGALASQRAAVAACLGHRESAITWLRRSLRSRPQAERRSRALTLSRLAELEFTSGNVTGACQVWTRFLDDYRLIQSARADEAFATMHALIRPHGRNVAARRLHDTAGRTHLAAAPQHRVTTSTSVALPGPREAVVRCDEEEICRSP